MSNNREKKIYTDHVYIYMGLQRNSKQGNKNCIRTVIKDEELDLKMLEVKLKVFGGEWRIYRTVNARDVEKARKWLIKHLIDYPENASFIDSAWRTALLQPCCIYGEKRFMLDIDTKNDNFLQELADILYDYKVKIENFIETPNGWHYITKPFDTREVCELPYVTLLRDGYYYVKTIGEELNDKQVENLVAEARIEQIKNVMIMIQNFNIKPTKYLDILHTQIVKLTAKVRGG